jgi:hypothetical protein
MHTPFHPPYQANHAAWANAPTENPTPAKAATSSQHIAVQSEQTRLSDEERQRKVQEVQDIAARMGILLEAD